MKLNPIMSRKSKNNEKKSNKKKQRVTHVIKKMIMYKITN